MWPQHCSLNICCNDVRRFCHTLCSFTKAVVEKFSIVSSEGFCEVWMTQRFRLGLGAVNIVDVAIHGLSCLKNAAFISWLSNIAVSMQSACQTKCNWKTFDVSNIRSGKIKWLFKALNTESWNKQHFLAYIYVFYRVSKMVCFGFEFCDINGCFFHVSGVPLYWS